ncbi:MAG: hypothetical protein PHF25_05595 [Candidatus Margulisbacteria bacterium]|nr:hypothetical protein [Candidatus Margulisiibacteriota bacterium]
MPDNQSLEIKLIKTLYLKYQQEIINIDGVFIQAQFNGLSDLLSISIKEKPFNTKMLIADIQFVNRSLEISNNVNESKLKKMVLAKLKQYPILLNGIDAFVNDNQELIASLNQHNEEFESVEVEAQQLKVSNSFRKIAFIYFNENEESQKVIDDYKNIQSELLKKITQSNKLFLLDLSKKVPQLEQKSAVIKILLSKICTEPIGSLLLLKVFKA